MPRLKLLVLGDARSGKSAIVQYVIDGTFIDAGEDGERDEIELTGHVPVSLKTKNFSLRDSQAILQLWEIAADADDTTMKVYYQNARGVFIVVDLAQGTDGPENALQSAVSNTCGRARRGGGAWARKNMLSPDSMRARRCDGKRRCSSVRGCRLVARRPSPVSSLLLRRKGHRTCPCLSSS